MILTKEEKRLFNRLNNKYTENDFLEFIDFYNLEYNKNYNLKSSLTNEQLKDLKKKILNKLKSFNSEVKPLNEHLKTLKGTESLCTIYATLTDSSGYLYNCSEEFKNMMNEYQEELKVIRKLDF